MALTEKQAHVLANLDRVKLRPYRGDSENKKQRFELEDWECTIQIKALIIKRLVKHSTSGLIRVQNIIGAQLNS